MKILAVIVSYNFEPWLDRCLKSLKHPSTDVLVVDNASTDQTCTRIIRDFPEVVLLQNKKNLGFGAANNLGFEYALQNDYDTVFLVNQDTYLEFDTIDKLKQMGEKYPTLGILSPLHYNGSGSELDFGFKSYTKLDDTIPAADIVPVNFINAAFWWIPTAVIQKVGGFSPLFPHYGEDVDFVNRLHYFGYKIAYIPQAKAFHCRENRPSSPEKLMHSEFLYFITEAVNLKRSVLSAFAYSVLAAGKKAILAPVKGQSPIPYLKMMIKLLTLPIQRFRNQSIQPGAYLNDIQRTKEKIPS